MRAVEGGASFPTRGRAGLLQFKAQYAQGIAVVGVGHDARVAHIHLEAVLCWAMHPQGELADGRIVVLPRALMLLRVGLVL